MSVSSTVLGTTCTRLTFTSTTQAEILSGISQLAPMLDQYWS